MSEFTRITPMLSFGNQTTHHQPDGVAVIHACKHPCHCDAVGYSGKISADHPHYLSLSDDWNLYLNLIDPPYPLFKPESFALFFAFADRHLGTNPIHIHCNQGESRAPSLTLLLMAKRLNMLPNGSFSKARSAFEAKYPYKPGKGIELFLTENWDALGD